jgi:hypothetical protein
MAVIITKHSIPLSRISNVLQNNFGVIDFIQFPFIYRFFFFSKSILVPVSMTLRSFVYQPDFKNNVMKQICKDRHQQFTQRGQI